MGENQAYFIKGLIEEFLDYIEYNLGYSSQTVAHYKRTLKRFWFYMKERGDILSSDISTTNIRSYGHYVAASGVKPSTVRHYLKELSSFCNYLVTKGYLDTNPVSEIKKPKVGRKLPVYLTEQEIAALFNAVDLEQPQGFRDLLILKTLYYTGIRDGELVNLKMQDIVGDFEAFIVRSGKGNKDRIVPIHHHLAEMLRQYVQDFRKESEEKYLFLSNSGKGLNRGWIAHIVRKCRDELNPEIRPHSIRHSFATQLILNGVDLKTISELLGHQSLESTVVYVHISLERLREIIEKI